MDVYEFANQFEFNDDNIYWNQNKQEVYLTKTKKIVKVPFTISHIISNVRHGPTTVWANTSKHQNNVLILGAKHTVDSIIIYISGCIMNTEGIYEMFSDIVHNDNGNHDWFYVRHSKGLFILDDSMRVYVVEKNAPVAAKSLSVDKSSFGMTVNYQIGEKPTYKKFKIGSDKLIEYVYPKNIKNINNKYIIQVNNGWECAICMDSDDKRVLVPCGHCMCVNCCKTIKVCPFCKKQLSTYVKIFD